MTAYYNEIDPYAAQWLRNLIAEGHIAPGDVDERSIEDVRPDDLRPYTQCHFFAGVGVWSHALRQAGWPDDRPVWTGSCPCPPFSAAGKGSECPSCGGKSCLSHPYVTAGWLCLDCGDQWAGDDRHLLPEFLRLIFQCRPPSVFGEQVASADGRHWLYTVRAAVERAHYALGAADLCAAGVGAPHIRQRLFFGAYDTRSAATGMEYAEREQRIGRRAGEAVYQPGSLYGLERRGDADRLEHPAGIGREQRRAEPERGSTASGRGPDGLADPRSQRRDGEQVRIQSWRQDEAGVETAGGGGSERVGNADIPRSQGWSERRHCADKRAIGTDVLARGLADADRGERGRRSEHGEHERDGTPGGWQQGNGEPAGCGATQRPAPTNGFWRDADWLYCTDGKWRPVEPGTFPLAHGYPQRVGRLRAYGNAICAQVAAEFVMASEEARLTPARPPLTLLDLMEDAPNDR